VCDGEDTSSYSTSSTIGGHCTHQRYMLLKLPRTLRELDGAIAVLQRCTASHQVHAERQLGVCCNNGSHGASALAWQRLVVSPPAA
jgi:hypothetical protein